MFVKRPVTGALALALLVATASSGAKCAAPAGEEGFLRENETAMTVMMAGMDIKPSGQVDRDFAAMMIAHHQGAIDMALAELRHGHDEQLKRIAQEIIVDQQQEIAAMRFALGEPLPPSAAVPTQVRPVPASTPSALNSMGMSMDIPSHHQGK